MTTKLEKAKARLKKAEEELARAKAEARETDIEAQAREAEDKFRDLGRSLWELGRIAGFPDEHQGFLKAFQKARDLFCDEMFGSRARLEKLRQIDKDRFNPDQEYGPNLSDYTDDGDYLYPLTTLMFDYDIDKNPMDERFKEFEAKVAAVFSPEFAAEVVQAYMEGRHDT